MKELIQKCIISSLLFSTYNVMALTDTYFATGEDLDFLIESDNTLGLQELEYTLRKFVFFRKLEDYLYNLSTDYVSDSE